MSRYSEELKSSVLKRMTGICENRPFVVGQLLLRPLTLHGNQAQER